ncbi:MAG: RlmI/RlmK family 23S rRNA methyltransferase [Gammaproteobacteria bacterium]|nr:MAG: RlmI/RlmK family 23S rRNA methyltransferase [Gammaproteobacteria bacterium]
MSADTAVLKLRKNEEKRLKAGHLWVYSNEIDTKATPIKTIEPGSRCLLQDSRGKPLGLGYVNPHSLIAVRLLTRNADATINTNWIARRLRSALTLRERCFQQPYYRWIYGDADGLPGLVVDRFGDYAVAQLNTAGMEALKEQVVAAIVNVMSPKGLLLRCDSAARAADGLDSYVEVASGEWPETLLLEENGVKFEVSGSEGQKTGWFYDHRENRARLMDLVADKSVLDVFSYAGGWGVQCLAGGASSLDCVDASEAALNWVERNVQLNGFQQPVNTYHGNAFEVLKHLVEEKQRYDVVVIDPPAFIKRKKDAAKGLQAYLQMNELAMRLLEPDGILVSASCSMHLSHEALMDVIRKAGRHIDRHVSVFAQGGQGMDHPVHPAIPETRYLKAMFCRVSKSL